ncbi:unnamed protein product [Polarella glacialis]|uniref:Spen paralogue and orthologue SPOC C-terminal domain-containing protein n=1 Tax=Polarella glacialis TaxID=89957 RepID=A0A813F2P7_POLGL|nr:unnamed protein product [Polarella glacialis]
MAQGRPQPGPPPASASPVSKQAMPPPPAMVKGGGGAPRGFGFPAMGPPPGPMPMGPPPVQNLPMERVMAVPTPMPRPVFLGPATAHIVPVSRKVPLQSQPQPQPQPQLNMQMAMQMASASAAATQPQPQQVDSKQIAMQFVSASKEVQAKMLQDPNIARAILATLAQQPQSASGPSPMAAMLAATLPVPAQSPAAAGTAPAPVSTPAWVGMLTLARNMGKRLPLRAALLHGKVQDVEVALRAAAANSNVIDITHRVPFEEVAKKIANGAVLSLDLGSAMDKASQDEYIKYFKTKQRAGVARLDGVLALYVLPPAEDVPALRDSLYALGPHIPRNSLIGLIAPGTTAVNSSAGVATSSRSEPAKAKEAAPVTAATGQSTAPVPEAAPAKETKAAEGAPSDTVAAAGAPDGEEEEGPNMSSHELLDLFSNPDLIKLLSDAS